MGVGLFVSQLNHHVRIPQDPKVQIQNDGVFYLDQLSFFTLEFLIPIVNNNS